MRGYVYVLVNSSLPGLVKVGKTTRLPSERVQELSGATGVPTPFVVAYEHQFEDCDSVEAYIHAALERQGLRRAANREFFAASPTEVIHLLLQVPPHVAMGNSASDPPQDHVTTVDDVPAEFVFDVEPWHGLMQQASDYELGANGQLQDYREAFKLYQHAARLGSAEAYAKMGHLTEYGNGVRENRDAALELYKKSVAQGNYRAYFDIMGWYATSGHEYNFHASLEKFLALAAAENAESIGKGRVSQFDIGMLAWYIQYACMKGWQPKPLLEIRSSMQRIREYYQTAATEFGGGKLRKSQIAALHWLDEQSA